MLCNDCGNEAHCGEQLKEDIQGMNTTICKKCNCSDCKDYSGIEIQEDLFNGE